MDEARYREAEAELWASEELTPHERWITLRTTGTRVRVQETGEGDPVLFVHGGPNAGSTWVPLAPHVPGRRLLFVDRPGTGLSEHHPMDLTTLRAFTDTFTADVLDELEVDRADVVASSFGSWVTLRGAVAHPDRVRSMVHLGCPAFVPGFRIIGMMRVLASPLRHLIFRLPPNERAANMTLRAIGHGASIDADRLPPALAPWYTALQAHTDTYVNEANIIAMCAGPIRGFDPRLEMDAATLATIVAPTRLVWGADDTFGGEDVGVALRDALPDADLVVLRDSGHLPWLDDPARVGALITEHLAVHAASAT